MTSKDKWNKRIAWCHFFGEVIDIFDEAGCPPADNVGAAHLFWAMDTKRPPLETHPGNSLASVTLGGFESRRISVKFMNDRWTHAETPDEIKKEAIRLAELIKGHRSK